MSVVLARSRLLRSGLVLALAGVAFAGAFGASSAVARHGGPQRPATPATLAAAAAATPSAPAGSPHDCAGAQEDPVTVELVPEAIDDDRMTVAIDVHHHFGEPAALVGAAEVIDDRGRRIGPPRDLAARALPARARTAYRLDTPGRLADGYYRVQVSVLARADSADDFSTHQLYFHVAGGALTPITSHDWLTQSASGLAFRAP
jgi:hypothetical protein